MKSIFAMILLSFSLIAIAEFDVNLLAPAKVLGKYPDKNSPTGNSWLIANGDGISIIREYVKGDRDLKSSLWGNCRAILPVKDASTFVDTDFCKASRNPEFDRPGLDAFTYGTPEEAAKNFRVSVVWTFLTLLPGSLFSSSAATVTYLIPKNEDDLKTKDLDVEVRLYRGTVKNPELKKLKLKNIK